MQPALRMWIERDGAGRAVLATEHARSGFGLWVDRASGPVVLGCGLVDLALFGWRVVLPTVARPSPDWGALAFLALVVAVPGVLMLAFGLRIWRRAVPRAEVERHVLDADGLEMVAGLPDDAPVKRFLREHGIVPE